MDLVRCLSGIPYLVKLLGTKSYLLFIDFSLNSKPELLPFRHHGHPPTNKARPVTPNPDSEPPALSPTHATSEPCHWQALCCHLGR
jgi:hypothetical protein